MYDAYSNQVCIMISTQPCTHHFLLAMARSPPPPHPPPKKRWSTLFPQTPLMKHSSWLHLICNHLNSTHLSHKFHIPDWLSCYWLTGGALWQHHPHHHRRLRGERVHHPTGGQGHGDRHLERLERGGPCHPLDGGTQAHHLHHWERHYPRYAWAANRTHTTLLFTVMVVLSAPVISVLS